MRRSAYERLRLANEHKWVPQWPFVVVRAIVLLFWSGFLFLCFYGKLYFLARQPGGFPRQGTNIGGPLFGFLVLGCAHLIQKANRGRLPWLHRPIIHLYAAHLLRGGRTIKGKVGGDGVVARSISIRAHEVFRRVHLVFESISDFDIVTDAGQTIRVQAHGAHLLLFRPAQALTDLDGLRKRMAASGVMTEAAGDWKERLITGAEEVVLRAGDTVEVNGETDQIVDPEVEQLGRETPLGCIIREENGIPFLIVGR